jgi:hypothetical protein
MMTGSSSTILSEEKGLLNRVYLVPTDPARVSPTDILYQRLYIDFHFVLAESPNMYLVLIISINFPLDSQKWQRRPLEWLAYAPKHLKISQHCVDL